MIGGLDQYLDKLSGFPVLLQIVLIVLFIFMLGFSFLGFLSLKSKMLYNNNFFRRNKRNLKIKLKQDDLFDHDLFINMNRYKRIASSVKMRDKEISLLFSIILKAKINSVKKEVSSFLRSVNLEDFSKESLNDVTLELVKDITKGYKREVYDAYIDKYGNDLGVKLYDLIMDGRSVNYKKGFNEWHDYSLQHVERLVNDICKSCVFETNTERFSMILYEFNSCVYAAIMDAEKAFRDFNGELDSLLRK